MKNYAEFVHAQTGHSAYMTQTMLPTCLCSQTYEFRKTFSSLRAPVCFTSSLRTLRRGPCAVCRAESSLISRRHDRERSLSSPSSPRLTDILPKHQILGLLSNLQSHEFLSTCTVRTYVDPSLHGRAILFSCSTYLELTLVYIATVQLAPPRNTNIVFAGLSIKTKS